MSRLRSCGRRLVLGGVSTLLALGLSEWAVRLLRPAYDPSGQVRLVRQGDLDLGSPNSRARQRKNTGDYDVEVRFGPRGFRDPRDVARARPADLLVVGDSFAFGWGVDESARWSNRLEALTGRRVFNIAIPGENLDGYSRLIRHAKMLGSRSENLIVSLCMENDIRSYGEPEADRAAAPAGSLLPVGQWLSIAKLRLGQSSALYGILSAAVHRTSVLETAAEHAGLVQPNLGEVGSRKVPDAAVTATADRLAELARGYRATVLVVPSRGLWLARAAVDADRVHRAMVAALEARGVVVVDPRAAIEATGDPLAVHFANDGHWNERGHQIAAECLARQ